MYLADIYCANWVEEMEFAWLRRDEIKAWTTFSRLQSDCSVYVDVLLTAWTLDSVLFCFIYLFVIIHTLNIDLYIFSEHTVLFFSLLLSTNLFNIDILVMHLFFPRASPIKQVGVQSLAWRNLSIRKRFLNISVNSVMSEPWPAVETRSRRVSRLIKVESCGAEGVTAEH